MARRGLDVLPRVRALVQATIVSPATFTAAMVVIRETVPMLAAAVPII